MDVPRYLSSLWPRWLIAQWENECISQSVLLVAWGMIAQWENECIPLSVLSVPRVMIAQWENECILLSVLSMIARWENECISLSVLSVVRIQFGFRVQFQEHQSCPFSISCAFNGNKMCYLFHNSEATLEQQEND